MSHVRQWCLFWKLWRCLTFRNYYFFQLFLTIIGLLFIATTGLFVYIKFSTPHVNAVTAERGFSSLHLLKWNTELKYLCFLCQYNTIPSCELNQYFHLLYSMFQIKGKKSMQFKCFLVDIKHSCVTMNSKVSTVNRRLIMMSVLA